MAWDKSTENDFAKFVESLTVPDSDGAKVVDIFSSVITENVPIDTKLAIVLTVTETSAGNGELDVELLGSEDSSLSDANWHTIDSSAGMTLDTTSTGTARGVLDPSSERWPYYKFRVKTSGNNDTQDTADVDLEVYFKHALKFK